MTSLRNYYSGTNPIFCLKVDLAESLYNTCLLYIFTKKNVLYYITTNQKTGKT